MPKKNHPKENHSKKNIIKNKKVAKNKSNTKKEKSNGTKKKSTNIKNRSNNKKNQLEKNVSVQKGGNDPCRKTSQPLRPRLYKKAQGSNILEDYPNAPPFPPDFLDDCAIM